MFDVITLMMINIAVRVSNMLGLGNIDIDHIDI